MKKCFKCNEMKPLNQFYKHNKMADGHLGKCIDCTKKDVREHREKNIDRVRAYDRERGMLPHRVLARKKYRKTAEGKLAIRNGAKNYRLHHPLKYASVTILNNAVRDKKIVKPNKCSLCGSSGKIHGHHDDYYKPLEVIWVCPMCHKKIHANRR